MLDDHSSNVESVQSMGADLTREAVEGEKQQMEEQLDDLGSRWDRLTEAATNRQRALDIMLQAAYAFHEKLEPFSEWLDGAERRLAGLEGAGLDVAKLEKNMEDQRVGYYDELNIPVLSKVSVSCEILFCYCSDRVIVLKLHKS